MHCLAVLVIAADGSYASGRSLIPCLPCRSELLARAVVGVAVVRRCFRLGLVHCYRCSLRRCVGGCWQLHQSSVVLAGCWLDEEKKETEKKKGGEGKEREMEEVALERVAGASSGCWTEQRR
uniref:Secreted protein n=1 Tax=Solanum tuberosum TaxID=4113 RepID=M1DAP4_SOLTU